MPPRKDSLVVELVKSPWWVSVLLAGIGYFLLTYILPLVAGDTAVSKMVAMAGPGVAPVFVIVLLFIGGISVFRRLRVKATFAKQDSLDSLNQLSWKEFEEIMGEYFRKRGYEVEEQLSGGGDGGVDLRLSKGTEKTLVQCKRWRSSKVGLPIVRELLGAITAENANYGIIVTTSVYTQEARAFANKHSIELMDGKKLIPAIKEVQSNTVKTTTDPLITNDLIKIPNCPVCGGEMVERIAKRGANAGKSFWGCKTFPRCRGTMPVES